MSFIKESHNSITITTEEHELTPAQRRLLKTINMLMMEGMTTQDEHVYFETCAELMRVCAGMMKQSCFPKEAQKESDIPYAKQAIEFSVDVLQEHLEKKSIVRFDN